MSRRRAVGILISDPHWAEGHLDTRSLPLEVFGHQPSLQRISTTVDAQLKIPLGSDLTFWASPGPLWTAGADIPPRRCWEHRVHPHLPAVLRVCLTVFNVI